GVPDAYELPQAPGHGYVKLDQETMLRFRGAYVSGAYRAGRRRAAGADGESEVRPVRVAPYTVDHQPLPEQLSTVEVVTVPEELPDTEDVSHVQDTLMGMMVSRLEGQGPPAHRVWLPPLAEPPSLDRLFSRLDVNDARGLHAPDWPRVPMRFPIGYVDKPFEQRRDLLTLELDGSGGNCAVVGGPQSGKSTVLRTLIGGLAVTHTPTEVQVYCIDLGGGALRGLSELPHVGGVGSRQQTETVRRILAQTLSVIDDRETAFAEHGIDTMSAYRQARLDGQIEDPLGDVVVIIDGWPVFKEDFQPQMDEVFAIAQRGLAYGVHLIIGANRWTDMRPPLRDLMGTRVELRLGDAIDSEIDRKAAKN
ncbi:MAG: type VII secretion protein EccCb, partial [Stackebrandtia sp.]